MRRPVALVIQQVNPTDPPQNTKWDDALKAFGWQVHIVEEGQPPPNVPPLAIHMSFTPNGFIPAHRREGWSYVFRPLATATPAPIEHRLPDFEEIAENSTGAPWLGVLRMDVDSLGRLFAQGLQPKATLSRMATLSRTVRLFFEGYVAHLCEAYAQRQQLYLLYAGGDDLFVVGAWSVLPELARKIRGAFRQLVGADHVTLSAGIAINHPSTPLYQLAETARAALDEQAKEHRWYPNGQARKKDAISFLQTPDGLGRVRARTPSVPPSMPDGARHGRQAACTPRVHYPLGKYCRALPAQRRLCAPTPAYCHARQSRPHLLRPLALARRLPPHPLRRATQRTARRHPRTPRPT
jgi:hypothetical protein